jgi:hypothetical protein
MELIEQDGEHDDVRPTRRGWYGWAEVLAEMRLRVGEMEQAVAFYAQLGFATTSRDGEFAIVERDGISLHFTVSIGHSVCLFGVTNIDELYQQYVPTGAVRSPHITTQPWGTKGFWLSRGTDISLEPLEPRARRPRKVSCAT